MSKNLDSVFADCVDDELEFDVLFEDIEDDLVDIVAGCNEAGVLFTEDFAGLTEAQLLEQEEIEDVEPEKDDAPAAAADEGCKKEAADVTEPAPAETKAEDEGCKKEAAEVCPHCGKAPCECSNPFSDAQDKAGNDGIEEPAPAQPLDAATDETCAKEAADVSDTEEVSLDEEVDALLAMLDEAEEADPIEDKCDCGERQGEIKHDTDNVEGVSTETPADAMEKDSKEENPIEDADDTAERQGDVKHDEVEMDGVNQPVIGAAAATNANGDVEDADKIDEDVDALIAAIDKEAEKDPICDADDTAEREAEVKHDDNDLEATKDVDPEIGGEVGDGKEVSGKENSAESQAHDVTKDIDAAIGANDKQQVKLEDAAEGPLEDDDPAEREGKTSDADGLDPALADDAYSEEVDILLAMIDEEADPIQDADDTAEREGEVKHSTDQEEGIKQDVIDAANDGKAKEDPIADTDDAEEREGKVKHDESDKEGVNQPTVAAALEDADFVDDLLAALSDDIDIQSVEPVVPDDVKTNGTSSTNESKEEEKVDDAAEDLDDEDIEAIEADNDKGDVDLDYEEGDDDDLIAAIDQGIDLD